LGQTPGTNSELLEPVALADAVELERLVVVAGEGRARNEVENQALQTGKRSGQADHQTPELELITLPANDIDQGPFLGAAQLVDPACIVFVELHPQEGFDHIIDENRGELRIRAGHRQYGAELQQAGKAIEKAVAGTED